MKKNVARINIFDMRWATKDNSQVLIGIAFPGASQNIVIQGGTQVANLN